jgi:Gas vesicle synthesis protein GvpO
MSKRGSHLRDLHLAGRAGSLGGLAWRGAAGAGRTRALRPSGDPAPAGGTRRGQSRRPDFRGGSGPTGAGAPQPADPAQHRRDGTEDQPTDKVSPCVQSMALGVNPSTAPRLPTSRTTKRRRHSPGGTVPAPRMSAAEAAEVGWRHIADLTGKQLLGVTFVEPVEDGWVVGVEVLEDRRILSSADILALYEAEIDMDGTLLSSGGSTIPGSAPGSARWSATRSARRSARTEPPRPGALSSRWRTSPSSCALGRRPWRSAPSPRREAMAGGERRTGMTAEDLGVRAW